ncbi:hypothetical protein KM043_013480 [Ampulex compressa]|nr:hypothetical protein KM043_013480 [Ampulex compressa]
MELVIGSKKRRGTNLLNDGNKKATAENQNERAILWANSLRFPHSFETPTFADSLDSLDWRQWPNIARRLEVSLAPGKHLDSSLAHYLRIYPSNTNIVDPDRSKSTLSPSSNGHGIRCKKLNKQTDNGASNPEGGGDLDD